MIEALKNIWSFIRSIGQIINNLWDSLIDLLTFAYEFLRFVISIITTIANYLYRAFITIFSDWFRQSITNWFWQLSTYLWTWRTIVLMALLIIAFFLILYWFIMRVIKWQVNYNATVKKFTKPHK